MIFECFGKIIGNAYIWILAEIILQMIKFIENAKGLTRNPLGIIALFISLIYGFACLVLSTSITNLKDQHERLPLIWFIISFPIVILIAFIFLVTKHHQKLYSPSDYGNDESFLKTIDNSKKFESVQIAVTANNNSSSNKINDLVSKFEGENLNKGFFSERTKENVVLANQFFREFQKIYNKKDYKNNIRELSFGVQAPEYFIFSIKLKKENLIKENMNDSETIIIRVTNDENNLLHLIAIGKDIIENNPEVFAQKISQFLENLVAKRIKIS